MAETPSQTAQLAIVQPNMKLVKKVMELLDDNFDTSTMRFRSGWSDENIAKQAGLHITQVAKIRSEAYGDLAEDPVLVDLRENFTLLQMEIEDLGNRLKAAARKLESYSDRRKIAG